MKSVFAFALLLIYSLIAAETWIYEKTVVDLPMGEAEDQLSLILAPDGYEAMDEGPTSFTIDEDENIYVKTRRKDIIKKFDRYGNYICSSEYERNAGGAIRFLGYHDGMIYTMSWGSSNPYIRRYTRDLEFIDCHKVKPGDENLSGLAFLVNPKGELGLITNNNPQNVRLSLMELVNGQYALRNTNLFDFEYAKIDLENAWPTGLGYRFLNFDDNCVFYIENLKGRLMTSELGIATKEGAFIHTNVEFDFSFNHGVNFYDRIHPLISRDGCIYHILITEKSIQFIKWERIRVEQ